MNWGKKYRHNEDITDNNYKKMKTVRRSYVKTLLRNIIFR